MMRNHDMADRVMTESPSADESHKAVGTKYNQNNIAAYSSPSMRVVENTPTF